MAGRTMSACSRVRPKTRRPRELNSTVSSRTMYTWISATTPVAIWASNNMGTPENGNGRLSPSRRCCCCCIFWAPAAMVYSGLACSSGDDPASSRSRAGTALPCRGDIMTWLLLILAGLLEVAWAVGLKYTAGFSRPIPSALTLLAMAGSVGLLGLALRQLPLGTAYAIWTGIGTVGTVIFGIVVLNEPASAARLLCILMIVAGIAGLKLATS